MNINSIRDPYAVPYTGADDDVDLGAHYITATNFTVSKHYTGFPDRTSTSIGWDDGTYTLTLTATSDPIWINGVEYIIDTLTNQIADVTGLYWFWITAPGGVPQLNSSTTFPGFDTCLVATVYWNTVIDKGLLFDERHWMGRDQWTHEYLHETVGARFAFGMAITFPTPSTFSIAAGEFYDEDIEHENDAETVATILYHDGSDAWKWDSAQTTPYKLNGANLVYNNGTALADAGANRYVNYFFFMTGDTVDPVHIVIGTAQYTTLAAAQAAPVPSLGALPGAENKLIYKVTYKNAGPPSQENTIDYRSSSNLPTSGYIAADHGALSGLSDDDHPQYWLAGAVGRTDNFLTSGTLGAGATTLTGNLLFSADNTHDIGLNATTTRPRDLFLSRNATIGGVINLPTTASATVGVINQNSARVLHSYGSENIFLGPESGNFTLTGTGANVGIGSNTGKSLTVGTSNLMIGRSAGVALTSGGANVLMGTNAGVLLQGGSNNVALGAYALDACVSGGSNMAIGTGALGANTGNYSIGIGAYAGYLSTGSSNTFIGYVAGYNITSGAGNVCIGYAAGYRRAGATTGLFVIDNADRGSAATEPLACMFFGSFNATVANQTLTINAQTTIGNATTAQPLNVTGLTTLSGNLLFSADNTYDIGASGATRPRNLFLSGDIVCRDISCNNIDCGDITLVGRLHVRTLAADPTSNATSGSHGEIAYYNDKWYGKTVDTGTNTNWSALN